MNLLAQAADAGRALRADVRVVIAQFGRQDILFHGGSVAYSALLAGVPFLLLVASALGYLLGGPATPRSTVALQAFLEQILPERSAEAALPILQGIVADVTAKRGTLGLVGAPLFAWFSTRFFGAMRSSLGSVFDIQRGRGFLTGKLYDLMYVMIGTVLVTIYLALNVYLALGSDLGRAILTARGMSPDVVGFAEFFVGRLVTTAFLAMMFAGLYKFLPNRPVRWESAAWGGVWGAALFEITRNVIFELATRVMNPASLYSGTLAAIAVVVFWAYYAAVVFLIGGVVARVHEVRDIRRTSGAAQQPVAAVADPAAPE